MKAPKKNHSIKHLRRTIERTQADFAVMIGVSKDAVISWENGRNPLSEHFAARIFAATGADPHVLRQGNGLVVNDCGELYKKEDFDRWRTAPERNSLETFDERCRDTLTLLLQAAATPGRGKRKDRLAGVFTSFVQWAERTQKDFRLGEEIDHLLDTRKSKVSLTQTYGEWRRTMALMNACEFKYSCHFPDDPEKDDSEKLTLWSEQTPVWEPGAEMKSGKVYKLFSRWDLA